MLTPAWKLAVAMHWHVAMLPPMAYLNRSIVRPVLRLKGSSSQSQCQG